jgi:hypothetical protein
LPTIDIEVKLNSRFLSNCYKGVGISRHDTIR